MLVGLPLYTFFLRDGCIDFAYFLASCMEWYACREKRGAVPWYGRQLERLNNMPVMGSSLEWTVPP